MRFINRAGFALFTSLLLTILAAAQSGRYTVQLEAAQTQADAEERVKELKAKGVEAYILKIQVPGKGTFFRVRVGTFPNANEARQFGASLKQQGLVPDFFIAPFERPKEELASATKPPAKSPVPTAIKEPVNETPKEVVKNDPPAEVPKPEAAPKNEIPKEVVRNDPPNEPVKPKESVKNDPSPAVAATDGSPAPVASSVSMPAFTKFQNPQIGFSFDYPAYWSGKPLNSDDAKAQRVNAGALFQSPEDSAFLNAIWNELEKANSPTNDNNLIVDVILKSMKSGEGTQMMEEVGRRIEEDNGKIKTYLDLKASFITPGQSAPMDFLGKAIIIRASRGILLVAVFYSKEASANVSMITDRIIASVKAPE